MNLYDGVYQEAVQAVFMGEIQPFSEEQPERGAFRRKGGIQHADFFGYLVGCVARAYGRADSLAIHPDSLRNPSLYHGGVGNRQLYHLPNHNLRS